MNEKDFKEITSMINLMGIKENKDIEVIIEDEDKSEADDLDEVLDFLCEEKVNEFSIKFKEPLEIKEKEFKEIIGNYDSSNGVTSNGITTDQYVYDEDDGIMCKIVFTYKKEDDKLYIFEIQGWREKKS